MNKPDFNEYFPNETSPPGAMKNYIIDSVKWLQSEGNEEALEIPIEVLEEVFDDDLSLSNNPADLPPLTRMVMMKLIRSDFAPEIFDGMLGKVGSSIAEIKAVQESGGHRKMPGMPSYKKGPQISNEDMQNAIFEQIQKEMYSKMVPWLLRAAATGNVQHLRDKKKGMQEALIHSLEIVPDASEEAQMTIQEMIDYTDMYCRLVDPEETSPEHFDRFMNLLISKFIENRVEDINNEIDGHGTDHGDHDPEECSILEAKKFGAPVMHVLWRRYYGNESEDSPFPVINDLQDVSCVLFDAFHNTIEFVGLTMHPALETPVMENLNERIPDNDGLREEVFEMFTQYLKKNDSLLEALRRNNDDDHAAIMVSMSAAAPQLKVLNDCITISASDADDLLSESDMDAELEKILKGL